MHHANAKQAEGTKKQEKYFNRKKKRKKTGSTDDFRLKIALFRCKLLK